MATNEETNAAGTDTRPPMLVESDYDSWKIRIHRYIRGKPNGKLIWKSIQNGPTPHPMVTDPPPTNSTVMPAPRKKLDSEFNDEENKLEMADTQAEIILSQGLPRHIFNILNQTSTAKEIWDNVEMLMQGSGRTLQQRKEDLFDEYERFRAIGNESIHDYFVRFHKLVNDMKITQLNIPTHQMNTKFVNNLPAYWGKYVTNVKQNMDISTTPYVQIYTHLKAYEPHANRGTDILVPSHRRMMVVFASAAGGGGRKPAGAAPNFKRKEEEARVNQETIPFFSRLYDDCSDEDEGLYGLKDLDAYSIGTTLLDDVLPSKEKDPGSFTLPCYINNLYFNKALDDLGASVSVVPFLTYTNLGLGELAPTKLIVELADRTVKRPKGIAENVLVGIDKFVFPVYFIVLDMPEDIKTPLILERPFLSTAYAKIDVFKRKITLRVGNDKVVFKSEKPTSNINKKVYALSLRERMKLDLEARIMGEALSLNRSLDPLYEDYIELNDVNEPLELRRNRVDDLEPTIEEGEVVDEPIMDIVKTRCDDEIIDGLDEYPSYSDFDRKIRVDCTYNLQFSCMIDYEHVNANFFPLLSINVMSKSFYNSIMKDKVEYKGKNVVGVFMNVSIFVGNFSVMADFVVVENIDSYRDEGMGDIIVGRPFYRESCIKARRFDGIITIYNGNDNVTYQMARSHPRFKHLINAQCSKMWPLLKVSVHDEFAFIPKVKRILQRSFEFGTGIYKEREGIDPNDLGFSYEIEIASGGSFDVIIGMDWLSDYKAEIICHEKVVRIPLLDGKVLRVLGEKPEEKMRTARTLNFNSHDRYQLIAIMKLITVMPIVNLSSMTQHNGLILPEVNACYVILESKESETAVKPSAVIPTELFNLAQKGCIDSGSSGTKWKRAYLAAYQDFNVGLLLFLEKEGTRAYITGNTPKWFIDSWRFCLCGKKAIGTKWVYRNKKDERGVVVRNKARLVAQGHRQEEGIDYDECLSFMGKLYVMVNVSQPPGFIDPKYPQKVYKVVKALYGLHQAPRAWYATLSTFLLKNGYRRGTIDKTLFIKKDKHDIILVQVYVDDIIFGSTKKSWCDEFEALMQSRFQMSSMGELYFFLGPLQVKHKRRSGNLYQVG
ncbi:uncharacterized mitochondrial protein-like protein [Tanacetum coccineum]|uniref:Uncharacterized mitochondrial protein-like protein n=1 Tax=Tanacetum coccineum TaxID=301880 RepID=A0ABQ5DRF7_9ASTR